METEDGMNACMHACLPDAAPCLFSRLPRHGFMVQLLSLSLTHLILFFEKSQPGGRVSLIESNFRGQTRCVKWTAEKEAGERKTCVHE